MATTYCTTYDVADFLRIPITANTTPNKAQVEKIINRKDLFKRKIFNKSITKRMTSPVAEPGF